MIYRKGDLCQECEKGTLRPTGFDQLICDKCNSHFAVIILDRLEVIDDEKEVEFLRRIFVFKN